MVKVDDHTVQFNLQRAMLQFPESLGDYPALIAHRSLGETLANGGNWMTDPIGTGPWALREIRVGEMAEFEKRDPTDYWGEEVYLDGIRYIDLGADPSAHFAALASAQVDILYTLSINLIPQVEGTPNLQLFEKTTAVVGMPRLRVSEEPYDNKTLRQAIQAGLDRERLLAVAYQGLGVPGEDHPVSPIHPEYVSLPLPPRDIDRAKELFGATWANVQPHSGAQANAAVFLACLQPGDAILGFDLSHGGHLTHGSPVNFSGKLYEPHFYGVEEETGLIDYDKVEAKAKEVKPKMIICGASAYSRDWDYERLRGIADEVDALLLADVSHPAGLIARGLLNDPLDFCHIVTTTTHKTLRGPQRRLY